METMSVTEFAALLKKSKQSVRIWVKNGQLAHQRVGREIRVLASEAARLLVVHPVSKSL